MHKDLREPGPYLIANDDSGHDYVIPIARAAHWDKWINSQEWEDGLVPMYADRIDGHFQIVDYTVDGGTVDG